MSHHTKRTIFVFGLSALGLVAGAIGCATTASQPDVIDPEEAAVDVDRAHEEEEAQEEIREEITDPDADETGRQADPSEPAPEGEQGARPPEDGAASARQPEGGLEDDAVGELTLEVLPQPGAAEAEPEVGATITLDEEDLEEAAPDALGELIVERSSYDVHQRTFEVPTLTGRTVFLRMETAIPDEEVEGTFAEARPGSAGGDLRPTVVLYVPGPGSQGRVEPTGDEAEAQFVRSLREAAVDRGLRFATYEDRRRRGQPAEAFALPSASVAVEHARSERDAQALYHKDISTLGPVAVAPDIDAACDAVAAFESPGGVKADVILIAHGEATVAVPDATCADRAKAVVLVGPYTRSLAALFDDAAEQAAAASDVGEQRLDRRARARMRETLSALQQGRFPEDGELYGRSVRYWKRLLALSGDTQSRLQRIDAPLVLVAGTDDPLYSPPDDVILERMAALSKNGSALRVSGGRHLEGGEIPLSTNASFLLEEASALAQNGG